MVRILHITFQYSTSQPSIHIRTCSFWQLKLHVHPSAIFENVKQISIVFIIRVQNLHAGSLYLIKFARSVFVFGFHAHDRMFRWRCIIDWVYAHASYIEHQIEYKTTFLIIIIYIQHFNQTYFWWYLLLQRNTLHISWCLTILLNWPIATMQMFMSEMPYENALFFMSVIFLSLNNDFSMTHAYCIWLLRA